MVQRLTIHSSPSNTFSRTRESDNAPPYNGKLACLGRLLTARNRHGAHGASQGDRDSPIGQSWRSRDACLSVVEARTRSRVSSLPTRAVGGCHHPLPSLAQGALGPVLSDYQLTPSGASFLRGYIRDSDRYTYSDSERAMNEMLLIMNRPARFWRPAALFRTRVRFHIALMIWRRGKKTLQNSVALGFFSWLQRVVRNHR